MGVGHRLAIRKNDMVVVIAGKDKGKRGKVLKVIPKTHRVMIERVNLIKRHTKPGKGTQQGGIVERENPLDVSNVLLLCTKCERPVRVGHSYLADGKKVRVCKACGEVVD